MDACEYKYDIDCDEYGCTEEKYTYCYRDHLYGHVGGNYAECGQ